MTDHNQDNDTDLVKFVLRLPSGLREKMRRHSIKNDRSMNQEMIQALECYEERMQTLDVLILANRELLLRLTGIKDGEESNVVQMVKVQDKQ